MVPYATTFFSVKGIFLRPFLGAMPEKFSSSRWRKQNLFFVIILIVYLCLFNSWLRGNNFY